MNIIDQKFNELTNCIDNLTEEELFINIRNHFFQIPKETQKSLENYFQEFDYWGTLNIETGDYQEIENRAHSLKKHLADARWLYQNLQDYTSKKLLYAILNNWYHYDFATLKTVSNNPYCHYFDLDIISQTKNEILVDLGAYIGDTVLDYIDTYGTNSYDKIYCYEITDSSYALLKNNLSKYENIVYKKLGISDKTETMYLDTNSNSSSANRVTETGNIKVKLTSLDEDIQEPITTIKMDIEGGEQKAILGSRNHIQKDNPKLLISVYHNFDDLFEIPKMIAKINPNYHYYLRNYGGNIFPTEIVLFAIPKKEND